MEVENRCSFSSKASWISKIVFLYVFVVLLCFPIAGGSSEWLGEEFRSGWWPGKRMVPGDLLWIGRSLDSDCVLILVRWHSRFKANFGPPHHKKKQLYILRQMFADYFFHLSLSVEFSSKLVGCSTACEQWPVHQQDICCMGYLII